MSGNAAIGGDTGSGFLTGVEPATPRSAAEWGGQQNAAQQVSQPVQVVEPQPQTSEAGFISKEEHDRLLGLARQQEKEKLYGRIEEMDKDLKQVKKEREEAAKARKAEEERIAAEARAKEEEQMELRDLVTKKDREWQERFDSLERQREIDRATFEREQALKDVETYRVLMVEKNAMEIDPALRDLVRGNTIEEVDASIQDMIARTNAIAQGFGGVASQQQPIYRAAAATAPPIGPMEQLPSYESLTPDDIRSMDLETYKKYRDGLLASASRQYRGR